MRLSEMLASQPPVRRIPDARAKIRKQLEESGRRLVVIDDDPTGTQTVHGVKVYMTWSVEQLRQAISSQDPVFYISTNSRSLTSEQAQALSRELGANLAQAAGKDIPVTLASRSDSTLRGHFPHEVTALTSGLGQNVDGILIAPAFFEAGRYTIDDVHWVDQKDGLVPADQTEFAKDPVFGFKHGNLKEWVEEKTGGQVKAEDVRSISLKMIREGGPEAVAAELMRASGAEPIVINAACYEDLEVLALGLSEAEARGKTFAFRCAACLVKVRGGLADRPLLNYKELSPGEAPGLVVVGSYVGKTSRQLDNLLQSGKAEGIELKVDALLNGDREAEVDRVCAQANDLLNSGRSAAVYTSRTTHSADKERFLEIGSIIMSSLCDVVRGVDVQPGFLVSKGGITSIEIARTALGVKEAEVLGQVLDGIPVWKLGGGSQWSGIPYVVFPGNVGDDEALVNVVRALQEE